MSSPFDYFAVNLTNNCNTICRYCFQSAKSGQTDLLNYKIITNIIDFLRTRAGNKKILHLTGGEPSIHKDFLKIIEYALKYDYIIRIQTNGIDYSQFNFAYLKELLSSKNVSLKISLDGWDTLTHEFYREKGSFNKIMRNIEVLNKINGMIGIKTCVNSQNIVELYKMLDFCIDHGLQGFSYNIIRNEGYAMTIKEKETITEIEVAEKLIPYFNQEKYQYLLNGCNLILHYFAEDTRRPYLKHFYLNFDGKIYPHQSCLQNELIGNIFQGNWEREFDLQKVVLWRHYDEVEQKVLDYVKNNLVLHEKHE